MANEVILLIVAYCFGFCSALLAIYIGQRLGGR